MSNTLPDHQASDTFRCGIFCTIHALIGVALAKQIDAVVVPVSPVALRCQTVRPALTLRYVKDVKPAQAPDGGPLLQTFFAQGRADLQRIACEGLIQFEQLAAYEPPRIAREEMGSNCRFVDLELPEGDTGISSRFPGSR
ncbi:MAG: hypothetical protein GXY83_32035 [Rhodopirellula sp.]|nr:hypothetical protein [Rhodopirellula sp.]